MRSADDTQITVRCGNRVVHIPTTNPEALRIKLVDIAGHVAGGLCGHFKIDNAKEIAAMALEIAAEILLGARP